VKVSIMLLYLILLVGCEPKSFPGSEMTYNGEYYVNDNRTDKDLRNKLLKTCDNIKCNLIKDNVYSENNGFFLVAEINKNEEIWLIKDNRNIIFFTIIQKKKSKFNTETLSVLEKLKKMGFEFKLIHLEEWTCNGEELSFEKCTRKDTEYNNLDYIEFVKSNLSEK